MPSTHIHLPLVNTSHVFFDFHAGQVSMVGAGVGVGALVVGAGVVGVDIGVIGSGVVGAGVVGSGVVGAGVVGSGKKVVGAGAAP